MWAKQAKHLGFTIVELLIVVVIIGILAAITIVVFNGAQQRAKTAAITAAVDQWEKNLRSEIVTQGSLGSLTTGVCLGNSASDFPAEGIFLSGECLVMTDLSGTRITSISYSASAFTGWSTARSGGKLPTTSFRYDDASVILYARGIWVGSYSASQKIASLRWVPNINGACARGAVFVQGSQALGTLNGGYCALSIEY